MSMGRRFRTLLQEKRFITSFGVAMPLHAMIAEKAGFDYIYLGGYDVSLTLMGLPDLGFITQPDMVANDEAIRRGKEYARVGADMLFCEFPSADPEYPRRFAQEIHKAYPALPLYFNYSANLKWHESPLSFEALADMGYKAMHVSQGGLRPSMQAVWDYAVDLKARGAQAEIDFEKKSLGHPLGSAHAFAGFGSTRSLKRSTCRLRTCARNTMARSGCRAGELRFDKSAIAAIPRS
jgi:2-methylisocitrate lyase-like PEP mutase family enzyme